MQLVDGVDVNADFSAGQVGQTAFECIDRQPFVRDGAVAGSKDVVINPAREQRRLDGHILGTEIKAQVALQAVFRFQVLVPQLIAEGPGTKKPPRGFPFSTSARLTAALKSSRASATLI